MKAFWYFASECLLIFKPAFQWLYGTCIRRINLRILSQGNAVSSTVSLYISMNSCGFCYVGSVNSSNTLTEAKSEAKSKPKPNCSSIFELYFFYMIDLYDVSYQMFPVYASLHNHHYYCYHHRFRFYHYYYLSKPISFVIYNVFLFFVLEWCLVRTSESELSNFVQMDKSLKQLLLDNSFNFLVCPVTECDFDLTDLFDQSFELFEIVVTWAEWCVLVLAISTPDCLGTFSYWWLPLILFMLMITSNIVRVDDWVVISSLSLDWNLSIVYFFMSHNWKKRILPHNFTTILIRLWYGCQWCMRPVRSDRG